MRMLGLLESIDLGAAWVSTATVAWVIPAAEPGALARRGPRVSLGYFWYLKVFDDVRA